MEMEGINAWAYGGIYALKWRASMRGNGGHVF